MTPHTHPHVHHDPARARRRTRMIAAVVAVAAVGFGAALMFATGKHALRTSIEELAPEERHALYGRTLENLRSSCAQQRGGLDDFCREQADFIVQFPECDRACQQLAERYRGQPTR
jgi:hypothetical protein